MVKTQVTKVKRLDLHCTQPDLIKEAAESLSSYLETQKPDLIAVPELLAVPVTAVASVYSNIPFVIIRRLDKGYGTGNTLEGSFENGQSAVLVVDEEESADAAQACSATLEANGLHVVSIVYVAEDNRVIELS